MPTITDYGSMQVENDVPQTTVKFAPCRQCGNLRNYGEGVGCPTCGALDAAPPQTPPTESTVQLTREDLIQAIRDGVSQAFAAALKGVDLAAAVEDGLSTTGITEAIKTAVFKAFDQVYGSEILAAIAIALGRRFVQDDKTGSRTTLLRGYKLCRECGQPILKKGQQRKHPADYRHAQGGPNAG